MDDPLPRGPGAPPVIPNYRLLRWIGKGTFGEVWLGLDVFNNWVAVKVVREHEEEFRGLGLYAPVGVTHDALMPITNVGRDASTGILHYAMQPADDASTGRPLPRLGFGEFDLREAERIAESYRPLTLSVLLNSGRLAHDDCLRHGIALAEAIGYLHRHDLVHRDIKPSNIILVDGRAKLADIGLVATQDATRSAGGTRDFVPWFGAGTPSGDLYALGKVLFMMATGRPVTAFHLGPALLNAVPWDERRELAELAVVFGKACETDERDRYGSAEELRQDLLKLEVRESVIGLSTLAATLKRKQKVLGRWTAALVAAVVTAAALLGAWQWRSRLVHRARLADLHQRQTSRLTGRVQGWSQRDWKDIGEAAQSGNGQDLQLLAAATLSGLDAVGVDQKKGFEATSVAIHPSGVIAAGGYRESSAMLLRPGSEPQPIPIPGEGKVAWRPNGVPILLRVDEGRASIWNVRTGQVEQELPMGRSERCHVTHAPVTALDAIGSHGAAVVEGNGSRRLRVWDLRSGRVLVETNLDATVLTFAPDSSRLAAGHEDGSISVFGLGPFGLQQRLASANGPSPVQALAFARDRQVPLGGTTSEERWLLASGNRATGITVWDLATAQPRSFCRGARWEVQSLAFHPDGQILASAGRLGVWFWDVASGQLLLWAEGNGSNTRALAFSDDGTTVVAGSTRESGPPEVNVWRLQPSRGVQALRGLTSAIRKLTFSPDGRHLAALSDEWRVAIWNIQEGRCLQVQQVPSGIYADNAALTIDPRGQRWAFATRGKALTFGLSSPGQLQSWNFPPGISEEMQFDEAGRLFLAQVEARPSQPGARGWVLHEMQASGDAVARQRQQHNDTRAISVRLTGLARHLAVVAVDQATGTNSITVIDPDTGLARWTKSLEKQQDWDLLRLNPQGDLGIIRFASNPGMTLLRIADGSVLAQLPDCFAISPSGRQFAGWGGKVSGWWLRDVDQRIPEIPFASELNASIDSPAFSPDGQWVAWGSDNGTVYVARVEEAATRLAPFTQR